MSPAGPAFGLWLKKNRWIVRADGQRSQLSALPLSPDGRLFLTGGCLPDLAGQALSLSCGWSRDNKDDEPRYILSDLPANYRVLAAYAARFHIPLIKP